MEKIVFLMLGEEVVLRTVAAHADCGLTRGGGIK